MGSHPAIAPAGSDRIGHGEVAEAFVWKRSDGAAIEAPPDERVGNRNLRPPRYILTLPFDDVHQGGLSAALTPGGVGQQSANSCRSHNKNGDPKAAI